MKKSRYTEAQILSILRQAEGEVPVAELYREHGMSNASFYKWRAKYALTRMTRLRPYLNHGILELDNNTAERAMRSVAIGRKNYLFVGSQTGGRTAAIAYTLIETAKLNGIDPHRQPKAKKALHDIWQAETREDAHAAFDLFIETYQAKYPKATECLIKDRDELQTFYDFPAQHWQSIRTSNPIESALATIRHRTKRSKGCLTRDGMLHMMFKLGQCAAKSWRKLRGFAHLTDVIQGVDFVNGIKPIKQDQAAA